MQMQPSPSRLESFSDGVIAVIITIMVLDLKVPKVDGMEGFLSILPTVGVYFTSFFFTAIYWVNHHHSISRLKRVDPLILWCNLFFLFTLSLLPFFTTYLVDKHMNSFSVEIYGASLFLDAVTYTLLTQAIRHHIARQPEVYDPRSLPFQALEMAKGLVSLLSYAGSVVLARFAPWPALLVITLVNCVWIVPTFGLEHRGRSVPHPAHD
jgi:uncharacterized membrane protein